MNFTCKLKIVIKEKTVININTATFLVAQMVKNLPARQETQVPSLGWEDPLEKGMATHSNILVWEFRRRRNLGVGSYSPWFHKESGTTDRLTLSLFMPLIPL